MGGANSRENLEISDSDEEYEEEQSQEEEEEEEEEDGETYHEVTDATPDRPSSGQKPKSPSSIDEVEAKLKALKLKYPSSSSQPQPQNPNLKNALKLYLHIGGNTPKAKWITSEKRTFYFFIKSSKLDGERNENEDEDEEGSDVEGDSWWVLKVGAKVRATVGSEMQLKTFGDQLRVDFVARGVWAMKFFSSDDYRDFVTKFQDCLFENTYGYEATEANRIKVYGKDFMGWVKPEIADDSMWQYEEGDILQSPVPATPLRENQDLREEFEEAANGGIQSLALGALDNSFLVGDSGIQVVKNFSHGIHGKGVFVNYNNGSYRSGSS